MDNTISIYGCDFISSRFPSIHLDLFRFNLFRFDFVSRFTRTQLEKTPWSPYQAW